MAEAKTLRARRRRVLLALAAMLSAASFAAPSDSLRPPDLCEIVRLDSTIRLDIRYATRNNFTGEAVYPAARAFLQRPAALALLRVQRKLLRLGYGIVVFDAYRPWSITKKFWDITPPEKRQFVANPRYGSRHNRGCAVDCSLVIRSSGEEVEMTSAYDDFTERAAAFYAGGTPAQRAARDLLRKVMTEEGFAVNPDEWWHFDYRDWRYYPVLDTPFSAIR